MVALLEPDELSRAIATRLSGKTPSLPVLPEIALRVLDLFNADDPEPDALVRLLNRDPALAAHLMKTANSAALRGAVAITTVQLAVVRLGMRMVGVSMLSACLGPQLFRAPAWKLPAPIAEPICFWSDFRKASEARDNVAMVVVARWLVSVCAADAAPAGPTEQAIAECAALALDDDRLARLIERQHAVQGLVDAMLAH